MDKSLRLLSSTKSQWYKFINTNRPGPDIPDTLIIDLSDCNFLEPIHIVMISCLIEEYYQLGSKIEFQTGNRLEVNEYLRGINFFDYWTDGFNRNTYTPTFKATNLALWKLDGSMISEYVIRAQKYFEQNYMQGKSVEPLNIALAEIFNNILDHSQSSVTGYCLSQYYPNSQKMKIAVCDFGKGIPIVVNDYLASFGNAPLKHDLAIIKSLEKTFSSKSAPHNKGLGLDTIKEIVLSCSGELRIISNYGYYHLGPSGPNHYLLKSTFEGTLLEIILDTNTFGAKDEDFRIEDFEF